MAKETYSSPRWLGVQHELQLCGNDRTTLLWTPTAASGTANPSTMSDTGKAEVFGRRVKLKYLLYTVDTATTAGDATTSKVNFLVYKNASAAGTLSVTTGAALSVSTSSALDIDLAATDYIRIYSNSIQTASANAGAIGQVTAIYEEMFA